MRTIKEIEGYSFENFVKGMESKSRRDLEIIAYFWEMKGMKFPTHAVASLNLRRSLKAANVLKDYPANRVIEVTEWLKKNSKFVWTLETVITLMHEDLKKKSQYV